MEDIDTIYYNNFGIAFQWKQCAVKDFNKVQLVFRHTGLSFTYEQLHTFLSCIDRAFKQCHECTRYETKKGCRQVCLQTPFPEVSLAIHKAELVAIQDLVKGALFHLNFDNVLNDILSK